MKGGLGVLHSCSCCGAWDHPCLVNKHLIHGRAGVWTGADVPWLFSIAHVKRLH
jgi:hypothetical protein